jgi:hypothetical protein
MIREQGGGFVPPLSPAQIEYQKYLKSWRWKLLRWLRVRIDGRRCRTCKSFNALQCHHPDYEHKGGSFVAELRDIITLCDKCHGKIHGSTPGAPAPG